MPFMHPRITHPAKCNRRQPLQWPTRQTPQQIGQCSLPTNLTNTVDWGDLHGPQRIGRTITMKSFHFALMLGLSLPIEAAATVDTMTGINPLKDPLMATT